MNELMTECMHEKINWQYFINSVYDEYQCDTYFVHAFTDGCVYAIQVAFRYRM